MKDGTILFLCSAGGAKSVMAASYFTRLADELTLPYAAIAAAAEEPYPAVPEPVADFLERDGIDVRSFRPRRVEQDELRSAARVVSIDCNLDALDLAGIAVEPWNDIPKVSEDLDGWAAAIPRHVETLAEELRGRR